MTTAAPEQPFRIDRKEMADDAITGFLTPDGAASVAALAVRAVVAVRFSSWLLHRYGRRRAIATTFALFGLSQVATRALTWTVRKAATHDSQPDWVKVPPWLALNAAERRLLVTAAADRLRP
jgi:hypothetical protein